jgi:hypothetical protein
MLGEKLQQECSMMKTLGLLLALGGRGANQSVIPVNIKCGIKPIAPIECSNADAVCVCDEDGNCAWQFLGCGQAARG